MPDKALTRLLKAFESRGLYQAFKGLLKAFERHFKGFDKAFESHSKAFKGLKVFEGPFNGLLKAF
jgi:hypothetical protein